MIRTASYTDTGGRPYNEDCLAFIDRGGALCAVVADGLGGHGGGEKASRAAAECVQELWSGAVSETELAALVQAAHGRVLSMQTRACAMKTTITVLALGGGRAAWTHVGDSRIYHFHNGSLVFQTRDHSASQIAVMLGNITPDQIRFHEARARIYRALGQDGELKVETHAETLEKGAHAFLMCTDGFWEYVLEDEMCADLSAAQGPEEWLGLMRARLAQRVPGNNDNNTAAAVWLETE